MMIFGTVYAYAVLFNFYVRFRVGYVRIRPIYVRISTKK